MFTRARAHQSQEQSNQPGHAEKAVQRANDSATIIQRAQALPASELSASDIQALQRTIGNRGVQRLLAAQLAASSTPAATARPVVQAKLMVGPAVDHYEQEADRIAQQVTSEPVSASGAKSIQRQADEDEPVQRKPLAASITPLVQRQPQPGEEDEPVQMPPSVQRQPAVEEDEPVQAKKTAASASEGFVAPDQFASRLRANRGNGSSLPEPVRARMEGLFGADFSRVRVHYDAEAMALNRQIGAKAFTHGTDIYIRPGTFDPGSQPGQQLLAHELTHVVQQGAAGQAGKRTQRKPASLADGSVIQRNPFARQDDPWREKEPEKPGRLRRAWNWITGKKQTVYDPMQERQKPPLVASGVSGLGSVTSGVSGLASLAASSATAATQGASAAGVLGAIAGPMNVVSGLYNASKAENSRQRAEGRLSAVAGLGQTFTGTALGVQSISNLANVSTTGTQALSAAVLPAQIAMGAVDVVRGLYGGIKAHARQSKLKKLSQTVRTPEDRKFAQFAAKYQDKRRRTALLNQASGATAVLGGTMLATGVGLPVAIPLLVASGVLKAGALFGGAIREKYINLKRRFSNWWSGENKPSYAEEKRAKEDEWAEYAERKLRLSNYDVEGRRNVERTLKIMGMHQETIERIKWEDDPAKRLAIIRSLLMRR
jgi:Domain of unknown function (DUF4157)